jgi:hypothetical protein
MDEPGRRRSTLSRNGLSLIVLTYVGVGLGDAAPAGNGDAGGAVGDGGGGAVGTGDGDGEGFGDAEGDAEGDDDGDDDGEGEAVGDDALGVALQPPARKMYCVSLPLHPFTTPDGCEYQLCMFAGRALTNRFITLLPTISP